MAAPVALHPNTRSRSKKSSSSRDGIKETRVTEGVSLRRSQRLNPALSKADAISMPFAPKLSEKSKSNAKPKHGTALAPCSLVAAEAICSRKGGDVVKSPEAKRQKALRGDIENTASIQNVGVADSASSTTLSDFSCVSLLDASTPLKQAESATLSSKGGEGSSYRNPSVIMEQGGIREGGHISISHLDKGSYPLTGRPIRSTVLYTSDEDSKFIDSRCRFPLSNGAKQSIREFRDVVSSTRLSSRFPLSNSVKSLNVQNLSPATLVAPTETASILETGTQSSSEELSKFGFVPAYFTPNASLFSPSAMETSKTLPSFPNECTQKEASSPLLQTPLKYAERTPISGTLRGFPSQQQTPLRYIAANGSKAVDGEHATAVTAPISPQRAQFSDASPFSKKSVTPVSQPYRFSPSHSVPKYSFQQKWINASTPLALHHRRTPTLVDTHTIADAATTLDMPTMSTPDAHTPAALDTHTPSVLDMHAPANLHIQARTTLEAHTHTSLESPMKSTASSNDGQLSQGSAKASPILDDGKRDLGAVVYGGVALKDASGLCSALLECPVNPLPSDIIPNLSQRLFLGNGLTELKKVYKCLRNGLDHCYRHGKTPLFQYLKPIIEKLNDQKKFTLGHLQQLCWLAPSLLRMQWKYVGQSNSTTTPIDQFDAELLEVDDTGATSQRLEDAASNNNRLRKFHSVCIRWIQRQHEAYLLRNGLSGHLRPIEQLNGWHPGFDVESVIMPPRVEVKRIVSPKQQSPRGSRKSSLSPVLLRSLETSTTPILKREGRSPVLHRGESPIQLVAQRNNSPFLTPKKWTNSPISYVSPQRPWKASSENQSPFRLLAADATFDKATNSNSADSPLSPKSIVHTPGTYLDAEGLSRILEKTRRSERAKALSMKLHERDKHVSENLEYWKDMLWIFERLTEDFSTNHKYPLSKISYLCDKYSSKFTHTVSYDKARECILKLAELFPKIVSTMKTLGENGQLNIKFHSSANLRSATEYLNNKIQAAEKEIIDCKSARQSEFERLWAKEGDGAFDTPIREAFESPIKQSANSRSVVQHNFLLY